MPATEGQIQLQYSLPLPCKAVKTGDLPTMQLGQGQGHEDLPANFDRLTLDASNEASTTQLFPSPPDSPFKLPSLPASAMKLISPDRRDGFCPAGIHQFEFGHLEDISDEDLSDEDIDGAEDEDQDEEYEDFDFDAPPSNPFATESTESNKPIAISAFHDLELGTDPVFLLGKRIVRAFHNTDITCMIVLDTARRLTTPQAYLVIFVRKDHLAYLDAEDDGYSKAKRRDESPWQHRPDADHPIPTTFLADPAIQSADFDPSTRRSLRNSVYGLPLITEAISGYRVSTEITESADGMANVRNVYHRVIGYRTDRMEKLGYIWAERETPPNLTELVYFDVVMRARPVSLKQEWAYEM
ncbi:uncharacterized protein BDZ99DRAFT_460524 [Mytilinidion resinicola]|uniref:Uncharacterized protein n=1 Tax=Mytilinidion resinicola TaxID=574789 RepID=A0A6A6YWV3_9PEZI|nr:uncharacterized protein BDZ99DRAFT_460524 [Mytilinidion resinicola]KAF2813250.1 hypothetical protein BDZ99DRAFT_460524 [Mytilinidion resinicola]